MPLPDDTLYPALLQGGHKSNTIKANSAILDTPVAHSLVVNYARGASQEFT